MTPKELAKKTIRDIIKKKSKPDYEFYAYKREQNSRKLRNWSVRVGGCRW